MNIREELQEMVGDDQPLKFYDGIDKAVIGIAERINLGPVVAYDVELIIESLMVDMTHEEAIEWYNFNIIGGWIGEETPVFISKPEPTYSSDKITLNNSLVQNDLYNIINTPMTNLSIRHDDGRVNLVVINNDEDSETLYEYVDMESLLEDTLTIKKLKGLI